MCVWQYNGNIRRKKVDTSCVKQSDKPKYVAHVLREAVPKNKSITTTRLSTYVAYILRGAVSKRLRYVPRAEITDIII